MNRATETVGMDDVEAMPLVRRELPGRFENFQPSRESSLDNEAMAAHGFPGSDAERFRLMGRIGGHMREFVSVVPSFGTDGVDFMVATVAHLFETPDAVHEWMHEVFLRDFEVNVGADIGSNQRLVGSERLEPAGFFDEAVALKALHEDNGRLISVTIVDFRVGRVLGVAFVGTLGDHVRLDEATELGGGAGAEHRERGAGIGWVRCGEGPVLLMGAGVRFEIAFDAGFTPIPTFPRRGLRGVGIRYFICDAVALQYISIFTVIPNEARNLASLTASGLGL